MSEDVKLEVIRNTQDSLSKYIKKPPLTEKLLRKPPFRYIHDITTSVMRETGFLQGLYSQDELNPENIKDREAKIDFLEKLITAVNLSTGVTITARPNKIVAGLEVAKTNELLQTIAKALEKNIDSSQAVEQVLNKKNKGLNQQTSTKKDSSKTKPSKDGKADDSRTREPRNSDALKKKTKDSKSKNVIKPESRKEKRPSKDVSPKKISKGPIIEKVGVVEKRDNAESLQENSPDTQSKKAEQPATVAPSQPTPLPTTPPTPPQPLASPEHTHERSKAQSKTSEDVDTQQTQPETKPDLRKEDAPKPLEEELKRPQSARAVHRRKAGSKKPSSEVESSGREEAVATEVPVPESKEPPPEKKPTANQLAQSELRESKRPRTAARPASARPGAPRVRDRGTILLSHNDNKVVSEPVNVIVDSKELHKEDDETLVTVEAPLPLTDTVVDQVMDESQLLTGDQGHLVSQILETQKELEDPTSGSETTTKVDIKWDRVGGKETVNREVEKLQAAIQALTRAANPLGKLIDFLQEDMDSMQTELETWATTNRELAKQLQAEERLTELSIEPLSRQLQDINQLIEDQLEETSIVKAAVIRNDERITRLLQCGTSHRPG